MELTGETISYLQTTVATLNGFEKRNFMARTVKLLGKGGQYKAEQCLGWCRKTIHKGSKELSSGLRCIDNFSARGRKKSDEHLPNLLSDIREIVKHHTQTDPSFKSTRLYIRITANSVRERLIKDCGYNEEQLPCIRTISNKLNALGYTLRKVQKIKPQKKR